MPDNVPVVLVVDVDPETHLATDGALTEAECTFVSVRSAEMALKLAARRPPSVLVVDGKIGGLTYLTERLRRISPHLHVVLLIAADHAGDHASPRPTSATTLLLKPIEIVRLRSTLRTALRLSAMSAGVKRMHGAGTPGPIARAATLTGHESGTHNAVGQASEGRGSEPPAHVTPIPRLGNK